MHRTYAFTQLPTSMYIYSYSHMCTHVEGQAGREITSTSNNDKSSFIAREKEREKERKIGYEKSVDEEKKEERKGGVFSLLHALPPPLPQDRTELSSVLEIAVDCPDKDVSTLLLLLLSEKPFFSSSLMDWHTDCTRLFNISILHGRLSCRT